MSEILKTTTTLLIQNAKISAIFHFFADNCTTEQEIRKNFAKSQLTNDTFAGMSVDYFTEYMTVHFFSESTNLFWVRESLETLSNKLHEELHVGYQQKLLKF